MKQLKYKIGIVGGADPAASCLVYDKIIGHCLSSGMCKNGNDFPEIVLINFPFTHGIYSTDAKENEKILRVELQYCIDKLFYYGVDLVAIACNTLHLFVPDLNLHNLQFVSIIENTMQRARDLNIKRLFVLATQTTIERKLYYDSEIEIFVPSQIEQVLLNQIIEHVHAGDLNKKDVQELSGIVYKNYAQNPFEAVVLGCTDLPVLTKCCPLSLDFGSHMVIELNTIDILAQSLLKASIAQNCSSLNKYDNLKNVFNLKGTQ